MKIKFNLNDYVYIKPHKKGIDIINEYNPDYFKWYPIDDNGYVKIQAWEFINIFGKEMIMNGIKAPFDMNIYFEVEEISFVTLLKNQTDTPPEFSKIVDKNFWDLT